MPSLCSISGGESSSSSDAKRSGETEATTAVRGSPDSTTITAKDSSSGDVPVVTDERTTITTQTETASALSLSLAPDSTGASDDSTPNRKKRRVTPHDDSGSKQKQQKKINQMTLSSFFNKGAASVSTPSQSKTGNKKTKKRVSVTTTTTTAPQDPPNRAVAPGSPPRNPSPVVHEMSLPRETKETDVEIINLDSDDDDQVGTNGSTIDGEDGKQESTSSSSSSSAAATATATAAVAATEEHKREEETNVAATAEASGGIDSSAETESTANADATRTRTRTRTAATHTTEDAIETKAKDETEITDSSVGASDASLSVEAQSAATEFPLPTNTKTNTNTTTDCGQPPVSTPAPAVTVPASGKRKSQKRTNTNNTNTNNTPKPSEPSAASNSKPKPAAARKSLSRDDLTGERRELLKKYTAMKDTYVERAEEVVVRHRTRTSTSTGPNTSGTEETMALVKPITNGTELKTNDAGLCEDFPAQVVANMALIVEGSDLPLSKLVSKVCSGLNDVHGVEWSEESVGAKIKLLSRRKAYLDPTKTISTTEAVDLFENDEEDRLWRWEVTTLELLDSDFTSGARKARAARKKVSSHHSALLKLVKSLEETEKLILDPQLPKLQLDAAKAKVSRDEEKVLRFERDAEKQRLADEAKARKLLELEAKKKAKEEALEAKKRAKEEALEAKKRQKEEAAKAREDEKRKKEEEKSRKEKERKLEERKKLETVTKQKQSFRSFFAKAPKKAAEDRTKVATKTFIDLDRESFDAESFRAKLNANASNESSCFSWKEHKRSTIAVANRKRRTKQVAVTVYKTVEADSSEWGASDYLEQTTIRVPNKYRFLSFHEDCRPPYRGTWSKKSAIVTGKNPFRKDTAVCDYDYDSEAEWEEGDDEMGENVDDDSKNDEDEADIEGNAKMYDFEDGFCVADDRLLENEEDADEDTKALYKKKMQSREEEEQQTIHSNRIRIIAPAFGGIPLHWNGSDDTIADRVEGFDAEKASSVLCSYKGIQLSNARLCPDAFPQLHMNQETRPETNNANGDAANKDDYSTEAMVALVRFVHHSTLTSKDKMIEELRASSAALFSNRAKATRKLDAIAVKKKHPKYAGVYWEVKTEILAQLGLNDLVEKKAEDISYDDTVPEKPVPSSADKKSKKDVQSPNTNTTTNQGVKAGVEATESASKKRKATNDKTKTPEKQTTSPAKKKKAGNEGRGSGKKESPKKTDVCAGMKNVMAQFVKRSPAKTMCTASSPNDADPSPTPTSTATSTSQ